MATPNKLIDIIGVFTYFVQLLTDFFFPNDDIFRRLRCVLLKCAGVRISFDSKIGRRVVITERRNFYAGHHVNVNNEVYFDAYREIRIGNYCDIGFRTVFITGTHELASSGKGVRPLSETNSKPIVLENFVWIGANTTILPGVRVGRGAVVAAGAVVVCDVEPDTVVAGVPAKKIRDLKL